VALIVAVLLVALAAAAATFMLAQQDLRSRQAANLAARAQAGGVAQAGIDYALRRLAGSGVLPSAEKLAFGEVALELEYADGQGRFNVNNLARGDEPSEPDLRLFRRLLAGAGLHGELANAVLDAIDSDSEVRLPGGAEDLDYLAMDPPRRAANRPLHDPAHLARVKGFTPQGAARLQPWVTALPESTALNVNSASMELLLAAIPGLSLHAVERLLASRQQKSFADLDGFRAELPEAAVPLAGLALDVASRYVVVTSRARAGRVEISYQALIGRKGAAREGLLWRKPWEE